MASSLAFTPLCGDGPDGPVAYLLQQRIGEAIGFTILIGCGWDERFDVSFLDPVVNVIKNVDAVLLSHGELSHLGALPYLVAKPGLTAPVYSTGPTRRMGEMFLREMVQAKTASSDFDVISLDDITNAFSKHPWTQLRYLQHFKIAEGKLAGITLTPFNSGHMVGGSIWKIHLPDGSDIIYAVDWCHKKERHLNGAVVTDLTNRPALLIAGAAGCLAPNVATLRRDTELLEVVIATLRGDGSVLVPVDAAGRMLEVALLLEEFWAQEKMAYPLVLLSHTGSTVLDHAQQQLEWMSDHITSAFGANRDNPFDFKFMKSIGSMDALDELPAGPKVVLACTPSLESGFARELLLQWAPDPKNTVCFVDRSERGTVADRLQRHVASEDPLVLSLQVARREPLQGTDLETFLRQSGQAVEFDAQDSSDSGDDGEEGGLGADGPARTLSGAASLHEPAEDDDEGGMVDAEAAGPPVLVDGFEPPQGCTAPMFPDEDEEMLELWDAYGAMSTLQPPRVLAPGASMDLGGVGVAGGGALSGRGGSAADGAQLGGLGAGAEEEPAEEAPPIPTHLVVNTVELSVKCALRFFDFSGRADGPILRKALVDAAPRSLVLVRGSAQERADLSRHCEAALSDFRTHVESPGVGTHVHVSLPPTCLLFLSDALNAGVELQRMQRYALAQLEANVGPPDPHHPDLMQLLPSTAEPSGEDVFIADSVNGIQLSHIKKALADKGLDSIFQGGRLVCGSVSISKGTNDKAHLVLEGALCDDFFRVRQVIYSQYSLC